MISKLASQSNQSQTIWRIGPWYVSINRLTRRCQMTSGDMWFPIARAEVVKMIRHERNLQRKAA